MKILEVSRPKIGKRVEKVAHDYFRGKEDSDVGYTIGGVIGLHTRLGKLGWTGEGSGNFSSVFSNPKKNYVLKISDRPDPGYATYVKLIKKARNKHFPKISDLKMMSFPSKFNEPYLKLNSGTGQLHQPKDTEYYVYLIEKLTPLLFQDRLDSADTAKACYAVAYYYWKDLTSVFRDEDQEVPKFLKRNPSLVDALKFVGENAGKNFWLDINKNNIMLRSDGAIVITDPYVEN